MSRGGPRTGKPGKSYANRVDLNAKALPATAVPNQPYGVAGAQIASQKIAPMANAPLPTGAQQMQQAPQFGPPPLSGPPPGSLGDLFGPTQRPDEHFMTGVDAGPGAGSSALAPNPFVNNQANSILAVLNTIQAPSSQVNFTKNYLAMQQENQMPH